MSAAGICVLQSNAFIYCVVERHVVAGCISLAATFYVLHQTSSRAHCAAPPFQTEAAPPGFGLGLGRGIQSVRRSQTEKTPQPLRLRGFLCTSMVSGLLPLPFSCAYQQIFVVSAAVLRSKTAMETAADFAGGSASAALFQAQVHTPLHIFPHPSGLSGGSSSSSRARRPTTELMGSEKQIARARVSGPAFSLMAFMMAAFRSA